MDYFRKLLSERSNSMSLKKMSGFIDPITLGLLIALGGVTLGMTQTQPADQPVATAESKAQTAAAPESITIVQTERTGSK